MKKGPDESHDEESSNSEQGTSQHIPKKTHYLSTQDNQNAELPVVRPRVHSLRPEVQRHQRTTCDLSNENSKNLQEPYSGSNQTDTLYDQRLQKGAKSKEARHNLGNICTCKKQNRCKSKKECWHTDEDNNNRRATRTYVNPNFLSQLCASKNHLRDTDMHDEDRLCKYEKRHQHGNSLDKQLSKTRSRNLSRSNTGSEIICKPKIYDKQHRKAPTPCLCSKCRKRLKGVKLLMKEDHVKRAASTVEDASSFEAIDYTRIEDGSVTLIGHDSKCRRNQCHKVRTKAKELVSKPCSCAHCRSKVPSASTSTKAGEKENKKAKKKCKCDICLRKANYPSITVTEAKTPNLSSDESELVSSHYEISEKEPTVKLSQMRLDFHPRTSNSKRKCKCKTCKDKEKCRTNIKSQGLIIVQRKLETNSLDAEFESRRLTTEESAEAVVTKPKTITARPRDCSCKFSGAKNMEHSKKSAQTSLLCKCLKPKSLFRQPSQCYENKPHQESTPQCSCKKPDVSKRPCKCASRKRETRRPHSAPVLLICSSNPRVHENIPHRGDDELCSHIYQPKVSDQGSCLPCEVASIELTCQSGTTSESRLDNRPKTISIIKPGPSERREHKTIHTYDCTCKLCQNPSMCKHPTENQKKKWRLAWSSSHPIELKPKPRPSEIKLWRVCDVFQHPRIRQLNAESRPPLSQLDGVGKSSIPIETAKSEDIVRLLQKPRIPATIDVPHSCYNIYGVHQRDCNCSICIDPTMCKIDIMSAKPKPIKIKSRSLVEIFRRPRIPKAVSSEEMGKPVQTKFAGVLSLIQRPRIAELVLKKSPTVFVRKCPCPSMSSPRVAEPNKSESDSSMDVPERKAAGTSIYLKQIRSAVELFQHPRVPDVIGARSPSLELNLKTPSKSEMDSGVAKQTVNFKCPSSFKLFQHPRLSGLTDLWEKPVRSSTHINTKPPTIDKLFQHPRLPNYVATWSRDMDDRKCSRQIQPSDIRTKSWFVSDILQRPRIANIAEEKSQTDEQWQRKDAGSCFPNLAGFKSSNTSQAPRQSRRTTSLQSIRAPMGEKPVHSKSLNFTGLWQRLKISAYTPQLFECECKQECDDKLKCKPPVKRIQYDVKTKPKDIGTVMQRVRITQPIDTTMRNLPKDKISAEENCHCKSAEWRYNWEKMWGRAINILNTCQPPRIPQRTDTEEKIPKAISDTILTGHRDPISLLQRPRIAPLVKHQSKCNCVMCQEGAKCKKSKDFQSHRVEVKPWDINRLMQRPRFPSSTSSRRVDKFPVHREEHDECHCPSSKKATILNDLTQIFNACQKPRIPQITSTHELHNKRISSDTVIIKQANIVSIFQHPRIHTIVDPTNNCECSTCEEDTKCEGSTKNEIAPVFTKPWSVAKLLQPSRIAGRIDNELPKEVSPEVPKMATISREACLCKKRKSFSFPLDFFQRPRVPQQVDYKEKSHNTSWSKPIQEVKMKPTDIGQMLRHPRIPSPIDIEPKHEQANEPEDKSCPCAEKLSLRLSVCQRPRLPQPTERVEKLAEIDAVRTKPSNMTSIFQYPRVSTREISPKNCECSNFPDMAPCHVKGDKSEKLSTKPFILPEIMQRPRIPNAIDTKPRIEGKVESPVPSKENVHCPCEPSRKSTWPLGPWQRPRISQYVDNKKKEAVYIKSDSVMIKSLDVSKLFQRPRVLFSRTISLPCICEKCQQGSPCSALGTKQIHQVETKSFDIAAYLQRPRILKAIDDKPNKEPYEKETEDKTPCSGEERQPTCSLDFCQRPNIPQPTEREDKSEDTSKILTKPSSVANIFQHPRIPFQVVPPTTCDCTECPDSSPCHHFPKEWNTKKVTTKSSSFLKIMQRPRILASIDNRPRSLDEGEKVLQCPCEPKKTIGSICPSGFWQKPRILQSIDNNIVERNHKNSETVLTKSSNIAEILQHPRIPIQPAVLLPCNYTKCQESSPCYMRVKREEFTVKTKPSDISNLFQHPRVLKRIDGKLGKDPPQMEPEDATCKLKYNFDLCQRPRISRGIEGDGKPAETCKIHTKSFNIGSIFQHPRIPTQNVPEQPCDCSDCPHMSPCRPQNVRGSEQITTKPNLLYQIMQRPRIPNAVDTELEKVISSPISSKEYTQCPCEPRTGKGIWPESLWQKPRIPRSVGYEKNGISRIKSGSVLTKPNNMTAVFQHPRIPVQPVTTDPCNCMKCQEGSPCTPPLLQKTNPIRIKTIDFTKLMQRPRIPRLVEEKPPKKLLQVEAEGEAYPCKQKPSYNLGFCQRPRIPEQTDREVEPEEDGTVLIKPSNITSMFQHPRILTAQEKFLKFCNYSKCPEIAPCHHAHIEEESKRISTQPYILSKIMQRPRVLNAIDTKLGKVINSPVNSGEDARYLCELQKGSFPPRIWHKSRIPQAIDDKEKEWVHRMSDCVLTKPSNVIEIFQHPRIHIQTANPDSCNCMTCQEGSPCHAATNKKTFPVKTKSLNIAKVLLRPRISKQVEEKLGKDSDKCKNSDKKCPCEDQPTCRLDFCQRPRISQPINMDKTPEEIDRVLTKPSNLANAFQHPRLPVQKALPKPCKICAHASHCQQLEEQSKPVITKPNTFSKLMQHPRIPVAMDTKPAKVPGTGNSKNDIHYPCKLKREKSICSPGICQRPRILQTIDNKEKDSVRRNSDSVLIKLGNFANILQRPRIPFQPIHSTSIRCNCTNCRQGSPCKHSVIKAVETKPGFSKLLGHPRLLNAVDSKLPKVESCHEQDPCGCRDFRKPLCVLDFCQRPRIPQHIETEEKKVTGEPSPDSNIASVFQHPRIPFQETISNSYTHPAQVRQNEPHPDDCTCCQLCEKPKRKTTRDADRLISDIVRTKPISIFSFLQRPRIPAQPMSHPEDLEELYTCTYPRDENGAENSEIVCPCKKHRKPEDKSISTNPCNASVILRRPRILNPIDTKQPDPGHSDKCQDDFCQCILETESTDIVNIFQHPRVPNVDNTEADYVKRKPGTMANVCQKPRLPNKIDDKLKEEATCCCDYCTNSHRQSSEGCTVDPNYIHMQGASFTNVFQHPRVLNAVDTRERLNKICECNICHAKHVCETIYCKRTPGRSLIDGQITAVIIPKPPKCKTKHGRQEHWANLSESRRKHCSCEICKSKSHCTRTNYQPHGSFTKHKVEVKPKKKKEKMKTTEEPLDIHSEGCTCAICKNRRPCSQVKPLMKSHVEYRRKESQKGSTRGRL